LQAFGDYASTARGLAASLLRTPSRHNVCAAMLADAGGPLLERAREVHAVRPSVSIDDLLTLVNAISLATEQGGGGRPEAARLLALVLDGITPG
jgi:hypothetical protein